MKTAGIVLMIIGLVGTLYYGAQALSNSETFNFLGLEVAVSSANWTPVIISVILLIVGVVLMNSRKKR